MRQSTYTLVYAAPVKQDHSWPLQKFLQWSNIQLTSMMEWRQWSTRCTVLVGFPFHGLDILIKIWLIHMQAPIERL